MVCRLRPALSGLGLLSSVVAEALTDAEETLAFLQSITTLGHSVKLFSGVGCDLRRNRALERMRALGLTTQLVQQVVDQPTGTAAVTTDSSGSATLVIERLAGRVTHLQQAFCTDFTRAGQSIGSPLLQMRLALLWRADPAPPQPGLSKIWTQLHAPDEPSQFSSNLYGQCSRLRLRAIDLGSDRK
jgi:hypothetical protein